MPQTIMRLLLIVSYISMLPCVFSAATFTFHQALEQFYHSNPRMPDPEGDGCTPTLNKKGATAPKFDRITLAFLEFGKDKRILEIGGAYGNVLLEALTHSPKTIYHLNDLDRRHLSIAAHRLQVKIDQNKVHIQGIEHVQFIYGDITKPNWQIKEPYDAILVARVLHFLNPKQLKQALSNIYRSLKPGGRVFIITTSPYVKRFQAIIPEYEARLKKGDPYPGFVKKLRQYANPELVTHEQLQNISDDHFMFLDTTALHRLFTTAGFKVLDCSYAPLGYPSESLALDGRENVGLIAEKPKH
jgi:SAM-dependent methyltransferase